VLQGWRTKLLGEHASRLSSYSTTSEALQHKGGTAARGGGGGGGRGEGVAV
jgi:hypothetical protein